ncbi:hypothetical protein EVAR_50571_1 [Eumeta japonica]|uniref:Uncharacterized protein n=1 Tax=Eumeta variegata TaxID=151549 RepID=A0A4C1ZG53_EUMVA|nr:hypothetical protein EVAR_50571_1 [Eumeta japonica]
MTHRETQRRLCARIGRSRAVWGRDWRRGGGRTRIRAAACPLFEDNCVPSTFAGACVSYFILPVDGLRPRSAPEHGRELCRPHTATHLPYMLN